MSMDAFGNSLMVHLIQCETWARFHCTGSVGMLSLCCSCLKAAQTTHLVTVSGWAWDEETVLEDRNE